MTRRSPLIWRYTPTRRQSAITSQADVRRSSLWMLDSLYLCGIDDWPNPLGPKRSIFDQAPYNKSLFSITVAAPPFNPVLWSNPIQNKRLSVAPFVSGRTLPSVTVTTMPFNLTNWPNPNLFY